MNLTRLLVFGLWLPLLISGCTSLTTEPVTEAEPVDAVEVVEETSPAEEQAPEIAFPIETFYALLVAEIAGSRERYDVALGNYMQQARATRDPDIAARAAHIARFLNVRQAALEASLLWVEISPTDEEAHFLAASELIQADRLLEAAHHSRYLLDSHSSTLYQSIGNRAGRVTDTQRENLANEYHARLREHPDNTDLLVGLGLIYQAQDRSEQALAMAAQALELDPDLVPAVVLEAEVLRQQGQPENAIRKLSGMLDAQPDNSSLRLQYARLLASVDMEESYRQFSILLQQNPGDEDLEFSLGLICFQRGLTEQAAQHFNRLTSSSRHASAAHYYLGRIAEDQQNWQAALEQYLRVEPGPNFMASLLRTTDILVRAGETSTAGKRLNAARARFPGQSERLYLLEAEVLNKYRQLDSARSLLDKALLEFPASTQLLYSRAMIYEQLDHLDDLENDLRSILRYEPDNAAALNALGYTLADRTDRYLEARELIARALQLKPDDPAILDSMGWVEFRLGNTEAALDLLQQAMDAMPDHEIAAHLGEVLWMLGEQDAAKAVWAQGLKLNPQSPVIAEVLQRLRVLDTFPADTDEDDTAAP